MQMKMQMKMSQQLIMTPQLQQAIKLLQLSRAELEESMREAIGNMIDDIQSGIGQTTSLQPPQITGRPWDGQTRDQFLQGFGSALSAGLDDNFNPFPSKTGSGGSYALSVVAPPKQPSIVGVGFSIERPSCKPPTLQEMNPNAFATPAEAIYLTSNENITKMNAQGMKTFIMPSGTEIMV